MRILLHWWRMLTEPSGSGRLFGGGAPKRWYVEYASGLSPYGDLIDGGRSIPMAYDTACSYARMFDGVVKRVVDEPVATYRYSQDDVDAWHRANHYEI